MDDSPEGLLLREVNRLRIQELIAEAELLEQHARACRVRAGALQRTWKLADEEIEND